MEKIIKPKLAEWLVLKGTILHIAVFQKLEKKKIA